LINDYWEQVNNIFNGLNAEQIEAISAMLFSITLFYCATSIATAYFGDRLIIYFKLEEKYPWLSRLIKYRRTIQDYSIGFSLFIICFLAGYVFFCKIFSIKISLITSPFFSIKEN